MKILVTGDSGFFGSHLMPALLSNGYDVLGLSRKHVREKYKTMDFDLSAGVPDITGIDHVIHLASDVTGSEKSKAINVGGTRNMLEMAKKNKIKSFVYASTGGVYGFGNKPLKETDLPRPENEYAKTKLEAELLCKEYSKFFNVSILRYFFPYGPAENSDRLINRLISKVKTGEKIELNKDGKPVINPVFIDDAVGATIRALDVKNFEIFNIGGSERVSILEIVKIIEKHSGKKASITYNNKNTGNMIGDVSKANRMLGFSPKTRIEDGISRIMQ